ncbi:MAG: ankyrin repeat domain-containing protein [Deltaproteobacteria bacterium]|jgi:ankyrin repeat protein|nr:ankyrin repeat domain-containing protein [Deltaproteobacteria bacterium]
MLDELIWHIAGSLHRAARHGDVPRMRGYIHNGADVNMPDRRGGAPLTYAAARGTLEGVSLLIECGADVRYVNPGGGTALHSALLNGHADVALLLIDRNEDIHHATGAGITPLHLAAHLDLTPVVRRLLEKGADIEARSAQNQTPLFLAVTGVAAVGTNGGSIRLLLEAGADPRPGSDPEDSYVRHALRMPRARAILCGAFEAFAERCQDAGMRDYVNGELARLRES